MDTLFIKSIIKKSLAVEAKHINNNLDMHILEKIKNLYEGRCLKYGYIKPNSIQIIKRSFGNILTSHFNGSVLYNIQIFC